MGADPACYTAGAAIGGHVAQLEDPRGVATLMEQAVGDVNRPVVGVAK